MKKLIIMLMALACITACTNDDDSQPDRTYGGKEEGRAVELKDTTLTFYVFADTAVVNIGHDDGWWIEEMAADDGTTVRPTDEEKRLMAEGGAYEAQCRWAGVKRSGGSMEVTVSDSDRGERTCRLTLATADTTATITIVQKDMPAGGWSDNIGLSTREVTLNGAGDEVKVETEGKTWSIWAIEVDGEDLYIQYYDQSENRQMYRTGNFSGKYGWLNVRVENWTMYISADKNDGAERTFEIRVGAGDYYDSVSGKQLNG